MKTATTMYKKPYTSRVLQSLALVLISALVPGQATAHGTEAPDHTRELRDAAADRRGSDRILIGDSAVIGGRRVVTWTVLTRTGVVEEVGVTVPVAVFDQQPEPADGPAGAILSLEFPGIVQQTTYFNHVEIHSEPHGHPGDPSEPERYFVPHYDLHFYTLPEAVVWGIPAAPPPLLAAVPAEKLPVGWLQPGPGVPQMGRHSLPSSIADGPFTAEMLSGFLPSGKLMHFLEPMVTRERLLQPVDFELPVPRPAVFGRTMLYPGSFKAEYDEKLKAWHFVYRDFGLVE